MMDKLIFEELQRYIEARFLPPVSGGAEFFAGSAPAAHSAAAPLPKGKRRGLFRLPSLPKKTKTETPAADKPSENSAATHSDEAFPAMGAAVPELLHKISCLTEFDELEERLKYTDESFAEMLLRKIDEAGMTDAECYHKALLTRGHFNKIKNQKGYRPGKSTVLALLLALELDREESDEMLAKAGYALSPSSKRDLIVEFCLEKGIYDVMQVNEYLLAFDQELLGAQ